MAAPSSVLVTVLVTLVVVLAFERALVHVSAQVAENTACLIAAPVELNDPCKLYFDSPALSTPSPYCCKQLTYVQATYGSSCYCALVASISTSNPTEVAAIARLCSLPKDCNVAVDMAICPCSATTTTPSPPVALTTPAGVIATPPGAVLPLPTAPASTVPVTPASATPASGGSSGGGSSSLAVPIGASIGSISVAGLVIYLIMSRCRIHLKWDMNAPCWCCYRRPISAKPESNYNDGKIHAAPATPAHGYRV